MVEVWESLINALNHLEKASAAKDAKTCAHLLRLLPSLRRSCTLSQVAGVFKALYNRHSAWAEAKVEGEVGSLKSLEVELYLTILACMLLVKEKRYKECEELALANVNNLDSKTAQPLVARLYYYIALAREKAGRLDEKDFMIWYRTACLKHDNQSQAVLLNSILRLLLLKNRVEQARLITDKTEFPENAPYAEIARNQYYLGKIKALQLNYPEAHTHILQATRKAPEKTAEGFSLAVQKLKVLVELLMGEIPLRKSLVGIKGLGPYLELVRAVRSGELERYNNIVQTYTNRFLNDQNLPLVLRLRHIVIKAGLKKINIAYSSITLDDIAQKLGLQRNDAEFVVAKAIRDGVIEATIDHEHQVLKSKTLEDVYTTYDPQQSFQKRIAYCIELRNDAVKAMQFPQEVKKIDAPQEELELHISEDEDEF